MGDVQSMINRSTNDLLMRLISARMGRPLTLDERTRLSADTLPFANGAGDAMRTAAVSVHQLAPGEWVRIEGGEVIPFDPAVDPHLLQQSDLVSFYRSLKVSPSALALWQLGFWDITDILLPVILAPIWKDTGVSTRLIGLKPSVVSAVKRSFSMNEMAAPDLSEGVDGWLDSVAGYQATETWSPKRNLLVTEYRSFDDLMSKLQRISMRRLNTHVAMYVPARGLRNSGHQELRQFGQAVDFATHASLILAALDQREMRWRNMYHDHFQPEAWPVLVEAPVERLDVIGFGNG